MGQFIELHRIEHLPSDDKEVPDKVVYVKFALRKSDVGMIGMPFSRTPNVMKEYDAAVFVRFGNVSYHVKESYDDILSQLE